MVKAGKRVFDQADENGVELAKSKRPKASTLPRKEPTSMEDIPDSAEDPGYTMSQSAKFHRLSNQGYIAKGPGRKFLASTKQDEAKSLAIVAKVKDLVEQRKQELVTLVHDKKLQIIKKDDDLQAVLTSMVSEVLTGEHDDPATEGTTTTPKSGYRSIQQSAAALISASKELQNRYNNICQQVTTAENTTKLEGGWKGDQERLQTLLRRQSNKVKHDIYVMLHGKKETSRRKPGDDLPVEEDELWNRFAVVPSIEGDQAIRAKEGEDWTATATDAEKAIRRLVKHLPEEDN